MSYVSGPKPELSRGAALSVLWLEESSPPVVEQEPPKGGSAHDVAVARAKARLAQRREAQRTRKLQKT